MIGSLIQAGGSLLGIFGKVGQGEAAEDYYDDLADEQRRVAEVNRQISLEDASVAEKDAFFAEQSAALALSIHMKKLDHILGSQKARYAKSGVAVGSGSPLETMMSTLEDGLKDAKTIIYNGKTAAERRRDLARRYRKLAEAGLREAAAQAALLEDAGAAEKRGWLFSAGGDLAQGIFALGEEMGWFK